MARRIPKSARLVAIEVLNRTDPKRNYVARLLNSLIDQTDQRQRATDLVFGTIRNRSAIDRVIADFASGPATRIPPRLLNIIRIAAYELIYRPDTPDYSILNEAVENAKSTSGKKQAGFVNALLRNITRRIANRRTPFADADIRTLLPQDPDQGCRFSAAFLPDPESKPADYLSDAFSLPMWLIEDWLAEFGFETARKICFASNRRPGLYIRTNPLKTTTPKLAEKFRKADIDFDLVPDADMIRLASTSAVTMLPGFAEGLFTIQDLTASQPARMLNPKPGDRILDLCAAPGVKTTQIAEIAGDSAKITATDSNPERLDKIRENTERLEINSIEIAPYESLERRAAQLAPFDAILLDVPCSNTGVLAKRLEARYRLNPNAIKKMTETQNRLLEKTAGMLSPNGRICYSTCSIQKAENSGIIRNFIQHNPSFSIESERLTIPSAASSQQTKCAKHPRQFDCDGGYAAIIRRK